MPIRENYLENDGNQSKTTASEEKGNLRMKFFFFGKCK